MFTCGAPSGSSPSSPPPPLSLAPCGCDGFFFNPYKLPFPSLQFPSLPFPPLCEPQCL